MKKTDKIEVIMNDLKPCPFCGAEAYRYIKDNIVFVRCNLCDIEFHNHVKLGCLSSDLWNTRYEAKDD